MPAAGLRGLPSDVGNCSHVVSSRASVCSTPLFLFPYKRLFCLCVCVFVFILGTFGAHRVCVCVLIWCVRVYRQRRCRCSFNVRAHSLTGNAGSLARARLYPPWRPICGLLAERKSNRARARIPPRILSRFCSFWLARRTHARGLGRATVRARNQQMGPLGVDHTYGGVSKWANEKYTHKINTLRAHG